MSDERSAREVVTEFIVEEVGYYSPLMDDQATALLGALAEAGFRVVSADAVVINRDDIPDGLVKRLLERRVVGGYEGGWRAVPDRD